MLLQDDKMVITRWMSSTLKPFLRDSVRQTSKMQSIRRAMDEKGDIVADKELLQITRDFLKPRISL